MTRNRPTFGFAIPQAQAFRGRALAVDELVAFVRRAEQLGFREVVVPDHILVPPNWAKVVGNSFLDAFTLLAYLAAATERIRLVLGCLVVPYRQPLGVAKSIATLDQLSRGRASLGIVPGYLRAEFEVLGIPFAERNAMTDEFVAIMRALWTSERAAYRGKYYQFDGWKLHPPCVQTPHVPIWVGGASESALSRAIRVGDVWHPLGFVVISDEYRAAHREEFIGETMQTDGMTPARLKEALRKGTELADRYKRDLTSLEVVLMPGPPPGAALGSHPAMVTGTRASTSGQAVVDWLGEYVEAGATGFVLGLAGQTLSQCTEALERLAADVIPAFA